MRLLFFIVFLLQSTLSPAQNLADTLFSQESEKQLLQVGPIFEVGHHSGVYGSLGAIVGQNFGRYKEQSFGFGVAIDVIYNGTTAYFGPRGYGVLNFSECIGFRVGAANYMRENSAPTDFWLLADVCFTLAGRLGINAGVCVPTVSDNLDELSIFRLGLTVNMAK